MDNPRKIGRPPGRKDGPRDPNAPRRGRPPKDQEANRPEQIQNRNTVLSNLYFLDI